MKINVIDTEIPFSDHSVSNDFLQRLLYMAPAIFPLFIPNVS